jgi:MoaA/NifB/PqqE/SkfB family radical SAM enzyme
MKHLYLEVTAHCDMVCSHCSVRSQAGEGTESPYDSIVEVLKGFRNEGGEYLTLGGGEPGLRPDLPELIDEAHRIGLEITVFTNGRAVSGPVLDALSRAGGMLALSLDGPTASVHETLRGPGTFAPAVESLRKAVSELGGRHVILSSVLSRPLLAESLLMWEFANKNGVGTLYLDIFEPVSHGQRHPLAPVPEEMVGPVLQLLDLANEQSAMRLAFSESDNLLCGRSVFALRPPESLLGRTIKLQADGWALPGPFYYAPQFRLGRPMEDGWEDTLASPVFGFLRRRAERKAGDTISCSTCFWRDRCAGGSLALTWATYGRWDCPCPLCGLYNAVLDRAATKEIHHAPAINA